MKIALKDMYAKTWKTYLKQSSRNWDKQKGKRVSEDNKPSNKRDEK